ncbi:hypothetical protein [Aeromicrobium massiliense]|uniref:hypothetical protein n=1 Tax=Aeromicrobium massiliense TaxID=1464554 RepID=UPI0002E3BCAE|nr:hypothetical protein [Aeromicrobium massiliense]
MVDATSNSDPLPLHRRRWALAASSLALVALAGIVVLARSTAGTVDREPWGYLALMAAGAAAIGVFIVTFAHTFFEHQSPSTKPRPTRG